jgi:c-di-GMP-binding flagellar brake protein YcgR
MADRRRFPRAKTLNLIAHLTVGRDGQVLSQGMGKALDISKGGMLLETLFPVEKGTLSLMAVDKDLRLFEMKAELVYCKKTTSGRYHSGIEFSDTDSQVIESITKLIKAYNHRKKAISISVRY